MDTENKVYVLAKYEVSRRYGGPEEGGWWYTDGDLSQIMAAYNHEEDAYADCRRYNAAVDQDEVAFTVVTLPWLDEDPDGDRCHSDGEVQPVLRTDIPKYFNEHRPHYC
jgi:hypothetical protein